MAKARFDPLDHFLAYGWREGRRPNPLFDPAWYRHVYLRDRADTNPLVHYIEIGEAAGCRPVAYFDPSWYRQTYGPRASSLCHYLENRHIQEIAPNAEFDLPFYIAAHKDAVAAGRDPFSHLIEHGRSRDLDPSPCFDSAKYRTAHMGHALLIGTTTREMGVPLVHYLDMRVRAVKAIPPYTARLCEVHLPESEIATLAAIYSAGGDDARILVDELLAIGPAHLEATLLPYRLAIVLCDKHASTHAENVLNLFLEEPLMRAHVLDELMKIKAYDGRPGDAARCFEAIVHESAPTLLQRKFASWCYARSGEPERAFALLSKAEAEDRDPRKEYVASAQFYRFYQSFGKAQAETLLGEVYRMFPRATSIHALEAEIEAALQDDRPYLLLRLGDGEGSYIHVSDEDERENADYYEANRKEFLDFWFRDATIYEDVALRRAMRAFNAAIAQADCIGGIYREAVDHEYRIGSRRGIAWVINTMRAVLQRARENPEWAERTMICHLTVHYELLLSGGLGRLIRNAGSVGLISCHGELPEKLSARFGVKITEFHKVPGEKSHSSSLGPVATAGTHWPDRYLELSAALDADHDRHGKLFLVAAGILGKIYAAQLKRTGAVVLDIGAVADLWMGKATRDFPSLPREVSLDL